MRKPAASERPVVEVGSLSIGLHCSTYFIQDKNKNKNNNWTKQQQPSEQHESAAAKRSNQTMNQHHPPVRAGRIERAGRFAARSALGPNPPTPPGRGLQRRRTDPADDGIRVRGGTDGPTPTADGIRVFGAEGRGPGPGPARGDASNTARIIARRRGLDGSDRAGGRGRGLSGATVASAPCARGRGLSGASVASGRGSAAGRRGGAASVSSGRRRFGGEANPRRTTLGGAGAERGFPPGGDGSGAVGSRSCAVFPGPLPPKRSISYDYLEEIPLRPPSGSPPFLSGTASRSEPNPPGRTAQIENQMSMLSDQLNRQQRRQGVNGSANGSANEKLKLYDEILSASDPKIGRWIGGGGAGLTASTIAPSDAHTAFNGGPGSIDGGKRRLCSKRAAGGFALLILGLAGVGAAVWFVKPWESGGGVGGEEESDGDAGDDSAADLLPAPAEGPATTPPPSDIEGRCSPSNLPGSLSACLSACLPSACCYPDYSGASCRDADPEACAAYRPHCDVFYDPWDGATEGKLRDVDDDVVRTCAGSGERAEGGRDPPARERVRGRSSGRKGSRRLESARETCRRYCAAAKCCAASAVAGDPSSYGLSLSPAGAYTDASSGEFVATSCRESDESNAGICEKYDRFCAEGGASERVPVPSGLGTAYASESGPSAMPTGDGGDETVLVPVGSGSTTSTATPSPSTQQSWVSDPTPAFSEAIPSSASQNSTVSVDATQTQSSPSLGFGPPSTGSGVSSPPLDANSTDSFPITSPPPNQNNESSIIPPQTSTSILPASAEQIQRACADVASDAARNECVGACQDGLCCYSTELGYDWIEPCLAGNELACEGYAGCLALREEEGAAESSGDGDNATVSESSVSNGSEGATVVSTDEASATTSAGSGGTSAPAGDAGTSAPAVNAGTSAPAVNAGTSAPAGDAGTSASAVNAGTSASAVDAGTSASAVNAGTSATTVSQEATTAAPSEPSIEDGPPVQDLSALCSNEIISDPAGLNQCIEACNLGQCCGVTDERSCITAYAETCQLYSPCSAAYAKLTVSQSGMPPTPPENIDSACSYDFLARRGTDQCASACGPGACCSDDSCIKGGETQEMANELLGICSLYSSCDNLLGMPEPPGNMAQICSDAASDECAAICSTVSCCFLEQGPSCYSMYADVCDLYMPFCVPSQTSMPVPLPTPIISAPLPTPSPVSVTITSPPVEVTLTASTMATDSIPPPPSDLNTLCTTGPSVFCQQVCMPAKCCFEATTSLNCFAQNQICREYAACSKLYER